jgi:hypothetical protein
MEQIGSASDPVVVALILAISMLVAWRVGLRMGRKFRNENDTMLDKFDDASMALFGLLLAFTFGTSMSKHDQRRIAVVQDSNAIGDFYTCATLLKEPTRTKLQAVIREYAERRVTLAREPIDSLKLDSALVEFQRMHERMTELVGQALIDGTPIAVSLTNTLNAVTSNQAARLAAIRDRLPVSIVALLFASAIVTTMLIGRKQGFAESSDIVGVLCFILLVSLAVYVTLDLNRPERGFIRVSQEPIERLFSSMAK